HWPSGENTGAFPRSVPGIGIASSSPRRLIQRSPFWRLSLKTRLAPSGDNANGGSVLGRTTLSLSEMYRHSAGWADALLARAQPQAPRAPDASAMPAATQK